MNLYNKSRDPNRTPLEDFNTEILVSILQKNQGLLDRYVNQLLCIPGDGFSVTSQRKYPLVNDINCIVDVVFENESILCFLENKVNSWEHDRQLERYKEVLKSETSKKVYLRYCTKYYDPKKLDEINFNQFRWIDVFNFFSLYNENELIKEYLEFLRGENMSGSDDLNFNDLITMTTINQTISKMDEILDLTRPKLDELFGKPYQRDYERLKQIPTHERYAILVVDVFGNGYSEIALGFEFSNTEKNSAPNLFVQCYCDKANTKNNEYKRLLKEEHIFEYTQIEDYGCNGWFEKPLTDFISMKQQQGKIRDWFIERLIDIDGFKRNAVTASLDWKKK